jgi:acetolactate synthase I/II/III large subunit
MVLNNVIKMAGPVLVNVIIPASARVTPQVKFGRANEDMEPLLSRDLFQEAMIVPTLSSSE